MDIYFQSKKIENTFNTEKLLNKNYGKEQTKYIKRRMAVLQAAPFLSDVPHVPPDRCHQLTGNRKGDFAVDLKQPYRLTFRPFNDPLPFKDDGGLDLKRINKILILDVEDYHK